jgi:FKBP-type peptidyl-prolyl cis-trans isomerase FkpA
MRLALSAALLCAPSTHALAMQADDTPATKSAKPAKKAKPPVLSCKVKTPEGLSYTVIKAGNGEKPGDTARVLVNYTGRLKSDGSEFDSGQGAKFPVAGVIPGFAQGLKLMQPGGKYRLCIPAALGYGDAGAGEAIPANADLVFEVEMLSFTTPPPKPVIAPADRTCAQTTASGLGYAVVKASDGKRPTDADMALVDFSLFDPQSGVVRETRMWEKIPLSKASAIFGEALKMMQLGSVYRFCMPKADNSEGDSEARPNIIVTLIDLRPAPEAEE